MLIRPACPEDASAIWSIIAPVIRAGETYEVCLTNRLYLPPLEDPLGTILSYRKLLLGAKILGDKLARETAPGEKVGLLLVGQGSKPLRTRDRRNWRLPPRSIQQAP